MTSQAAPAIADEAGDTGGFTYGRTLYLHRVQKDDAPGIAYRNYRFALDEPLRPRVREMIRAPSADERAELVARFSQREAMVTYCEQPCLADSIAGSRVTRFTLGSPARYPTFDDHAATQDLGFRRDGFIADTQFTIGAVDLASQMAFQAALDDPGGIVFGPSLDRDVCTSMCIQEWQDVADVWCDDSGRDRLGMDVFIELFAHHRPSGTAPAWMEVIGRKIHVSP